jgi:hypothetical protein
MEEYFDTRIIDVDKIYQVKEHSLVVRFEDEKGNHYHVGLSPLNGDRFTETPLHMNKNTGLRRRKLSYVTANIRVDYLKTLNS